MEETLTEAIKAYIVQKKMQKLEPLQKTLQKVLDASDDVTKHAAAKVEYAEQAAPIEKKFEVVTWLNDAAMRAKEITFATHAAKFTHGDAKGCSVRVTEQDASSPYVCTAALVDIKIDVVGNAGASAIATMLQIEVGGESLILQLERDSVDALKPLAPDGMTLEKWKEGFKQALVDSNVRSHTLSKQTYFPIDESQDNYHLICPLMSSSLSHQLYKAVHQSKFEQADIREAKVEGIFHEEALVIFPQLAVQILGGRDKTKQRNVSQDNSERYGQQYLLNCQAPTFNAQLKKPSELKPLFGRELNYRSKNLLRELDVFISSNLQANNNFEWRNARDQAYLLPLIDELLNLAAMYQAQTQFAGWANENYAVSDAEALWLDVQNPDISFQEKRSTGEFLNDIAKAYAKWLVNSLKLLQKNKPKKSQYSLADVHRDYIRKLCLHQLKAFERHTETAIMPSSKMEALA